MLENSKSIYFIKKLFTFVDEKTKLDIIKYNKNMQNIMDINLINYKFYSKKYIIYEENGKGKEYNGYDDSLKFEGEYLNGKRNGKGKEYDWDGQLKFEGEYLNGEKWNGNGYNNNKIIYSLKDGKGFIKEYYDSIILEFEGEYLNGERIDGRLEFEGEYLNGERNGKVKEYYDNGQLKFEVEYLNGERNGKGKEYDLDGQLEFEGEYLNGNKIIN